MSHAHGNSESNIAHDEDTALVLSLINAPTSSGNLFLPGISAASTSILVEKLKHNYLYNDAFFQVCSVVCALRYISG